MINTILFDLDGTLLPLDMDAFMKIYFDEMAVALSDLIDKETLVHHVWKATSAMVENIEDKTNEEVFMDVFGSLITGDLKVYQNRFDAFYDEGFLKVKESVGQNPWVHKSIQLLKEKGYTLVLATNPLFPLKAIQHRINWAGFQPDDFIYITSYETNHYCKPQIHYYEEILGDIHKRPEECMMVGNDVEEDMIAGKTGMTTFLINDHLLHRGHQPIEADYQGDYEAFYNFVKELPSLKEIPSLNE